MTEELKPLEYQSDVVFDKDKMLHITAKQIVGTEWDEENKKYKKVLKDAFNLVVDLSNYKQAGYDELKIIFNDERSLELGNGWCNYRDDKDKGFYTEWSL